ncbi:hypothetical protein BGY98DRAFT_1019239 [Russula aff. rugulosa BPL654]|nr:hypothetical protein BGY98DRAFT_1019239 [Russula aff. rugulosa BPL654]
MVAESSAPLINRLAFSRVRSSTGLLERAMALETENDSPSQGTREFDSRYKQALSLQQKTAIGLNALVKIVSNWVVVADSLPDSLPDGFSLRPLRNLADAWEKERASMRMVLAALTDDPAERFRYRCLSSTPSRSCRSRLMTNLAGFVRSCVTPWS